MKRTGVAIMAAIALVKVAAARTVDDFVARAGEIVANGDFTFRARIGDGALLQIDGYASGSNRGFRIAYEDRELLRAVDGSVFVTPYATAGTIRVEVPFPLHITTGYTAARDISLGFGAMPPAARKPFVLLSYAGLPGRLEGLAEEPLPGGGRRYVDDLKTGKCIELAVDSNRASVAFVQPSASGSLMIHEVGLQAGPAAPLAPLPAAHTVAVTNFVQALTFLARSSSMLFRIPMHASQPDEALAGIGALLRNIENGVDETSPPLPPGLMNRMRAPGMPAGPDEKR